MEDPNDDRMNIVVVNDEQQYSIWAAERGLPAGWTSAGKIGIKAECLQYVEEVWTDTRPLSLGNKMDKGGA